MDKSENEVNEPEGKYRLSSTGKKKITFFASFEEAEQDRYRKLAALTYEERLTNLEELRKRVYHDQLLPNGKWPPLKRIITVIKLPYEVCR